MTNPPTTENGVVAEDVAVDGTIAEDDKILDILGNDLDDFVADGSNVLAN